MIDFLIIGGGVAGLSLASKLAPHGSLTLLEAEDALGYHTSGRSAAAYEPHYGLPSVLELTRASLAGHQEFDVLSPRGILLVGNEKEEAAFQKDLTTLNLRPITVEDALGKVPILDRSVIKHAAYDDRMFDIDTDLLLQKFAKQAKAAGATIAPNNPVTEIAKDGNGWTVTASGTEHRTKVLINASGAWADEIAKLAGVGPLGLTPLRRSMGRIPAPGGRDVTKWPMMFGPGESWYAKPDAGALLVSPAEEDPVAPHDAYAEDMVLAEGFARYEAYVTEPVSRLIASWAGLRTFAPDRQLVLGRDPAEPDFIWCAGQGGYGMQSCHGAAQYLSEVVLGTPSSFDAALSKDLDPGRFS